MLNFEFTRLIPTKSVLYISAHETIRTKTGKILGATPCFARSRKLHIAVQANGTS